MRGILVRIGVDQAYGGWNAPVDPTTRRFVYVPIPEKSGTEFHPGLRRGYDEVRGVLDNFREKIGHDDCRLPPSLVDSAMHLDPDFESLTYGDRGDRRGAEMRALDSGDLLVFYAGLRAPRRQGGGMVYGLVGLFVVDGVVDAASVPETHWSENAHTRKVHRGESDIVVRARPGVSGRCRRCVPIGEYRDRAYRVREDVLDEWGGLSVKNGYIQRSARPPRLLNAPQFMQWFERQEVELVANNFDA